MLPVNDFHQALKTAGIAFVAGVPDSLLKAYCAYVMDNMPAERHIITPNEGNAIALVTGHYLATGELGLVYLQNSGFGNAINPLVSLADPAVYGIPMLVMIGWRGEPGVRDEPQHVKQGEITPGLLEAMGVEYTILDQDLDTALRQIEEAVAASRRRSAPYALLVRKGSFGPYVLERPEPNDYPLTREEAIRVLFSHFLPSDAVISTTGKASRELFELTADDPSARVRNFLTVGSMGHASHIALGVALAQSHRTVYCLDGDGALIMHLGSLVSIGGRKPENYRHILLNNGAHDSVGGQSTGAFSVDFPTIALAAGFRWAQRAENDEELGAMMDLLQSESGPAFLEVRVRRGARKELGRPTTTPGQNRDAFMAHLES